MNLDPMPPEQIATLQRTIDELTATVARSSFNDWFQAEGFRVPAEGWTATEVYEDYFSWCEDRGIDPLALPTFGRVATELYFDKVRRDGRVWMKPKEGRNSEPDTTPRAVSHPWRRWARAWRRLGDGTVSEDGIDRVIGAMKAQGLGGLTARDDLGDYRRILGQSKQVRGLTQETADGVAAFCGKRGGWKPPASRLVEIVEKYLWVEDGSGGGDELFRQFSPTEVQQARQLSALNGRPVAVILRDVLARKQADAVTGGGRIPALDTPGDWSASGQQRGHRRASEGPAEEQAT